MRFFLRYAGLLCLFALFGCGSTKAIIIDSGSLQTPVQKLWLVKDKNKLRIIEGKNNRVVPLKEISWIRISSKEVRNQEGKTYYQTEIELKNGNKIMSYRMKDGQKSGAFVCVDNTVEAKTQSGSVRFKLSDVAKISFE